MAITWEIAIANVNVAQKRADVYFVRLDDVTGATENYSFSKVILETPQERLALLNTVWDNHLEMVNKKAAIDAFIEDLEQQGKDNLEARE